MRFLGNSNRILGQLKWQGGCKEWPQGGFDFSYFLVCLVGCWLLVTYYMEVVFFCCWAYCWTVWSWELFGSNQQVQIGILCFRHIEIELNQSWAYFKRIKFPRAPQRIEAFSNFQRVDMHEFKCIHPTCPVSLLPAILKMRISFYQTVLDYIRFCISICNRWLMEPIYYLHFHLIFYGMFFKLL